jgi:hypothetical protein
MGEMADYYAEWDAEEQGERDALQAAADELDQDLREGFWRDRDGNRIHVTVMTDVHLQNAVRMMQRTARQGFPESPYLELLTGELKRRGVQPCPS